MNDQALNDVRQGQARMTPRKALAVLASASIIKGAAQVRRPRVEDHAVGLAATLQVGADRVDRGVDIDL